MNVQRRVTIFLSSPTDVQPEREAAERIVARLGGVYSSYVSPSLDRWERQFYEATKGYQESIAAMDAFDLVVGIVWKRIGSELPPDKFRRDDGSAFESGTAYEIESALAANRRTKKPSVYVFRKTAAVMFTEAGVEQERQQKKLLDAWWARIFHDASGHYVAAANEFSTIEEFETKFENGLIDWLQHCEYIPSGPVWDVPTLGSPYPGLISYDRDRAAVFFGRQLAIGQARDELLAATRRYGGVPALFVIGASGSGKSSLVRAGLLPLLVEPGIVPGIDIWRSTVVEPTADSLAALAERVYAALPELATSAHATAAKWARLAAESPEAAADALAWAVDRVGEAERQRTGADHDLKAALMLLVDQLESLFGTDGQNPFSRVLLALVISGRVWLLATMRSDRYADLQRDPKLLTLKRDGATYDLPPPGYAEISDIIKGPARAAGLTFAEREGRSLAHVLVEAVPNADALPLLQMTLSELFERCQGETLGFGAYDAIGGIEGAIATHANVVFASASAAAQRELDPLLRMLVSDVSRRGDGTVLFIARSADRKSFETSAARKELVKRLVDGRLLVSDSASIRVAHEALLRRWDRARQSVERIADTELRKARLRTLFAAAAAFVFLAIGVYAWSQQLVAIKQTQLAHAAALEATQQTMRAQASVARIENDNSRYFEAAVAALEGLTSSLTLDTVPGQKAVWVELLRASADGFLVPPLGQGVTYSASFDPKGELVLTRSSGMVRIWDARTGAPMGRPIQQVDAAAFDAKGERVVTASSDKTARIWDARSGEPIGKPFQHDARVTAASFDPVGERVVTASSDKTARIWNAHNGEPIGNPLQHQSVVSSAFFGPDGQLILTRSDNTAYVWDARTGNRIGNPLQHEGSVAAARFDAKGERIVTASWDQTARIWDARTGKPIGKPLQHQDRVRAASFDPEGERIVTASEDKTARIWDARTGDPIGTLNHEGQVNSAAFDAGGERVITASEDKTARIWDARTGKPIGPPLPHRGRVNAAAFDAKGERIVTASDDTARIWDARIGKPLRHQGFVRAASFDAKGERVVTASDDKMARIWDARTGEPVGKPLQHQRIVNSAAFDAKGERVVTASDDDTARIWDARTGEPIGSPLPHGAQVNAAAFDAKGERIITASGDRTARIWDARTGELGKVLQHQGWVYSACFDSRGERIVTASDDKTARIWDARTGEQIVRSLQHETSVMSAYFDPTGEQIVTASSDSTARIWDARTGEPIGKPLPHGQFASFDAKGEQVVTAGDRMAHIWDARTGEPIGKWLQHEGRVYSAFFDAKGERIVTASDDKTARIWDARTGEQIGKPLQHQAGVHSASFDPKGERVVTASGDHTARIWYAQPGGQTLLDQVRSTIGSRAPKPLKFPDPVSHSPDYMGAITRGLDVIWTRLISNLF